jgi:hypothetical protein
MKAQKNSWSTLDIHTAAYLEYRGIPVTLENINGRVIFTAAASNELYCLLSAFNENDPVPIIDYVSTLRVLKARMFSKRQSI